MILIVSVIESCLSNLFFILVLGLTFEINLFPMSIEDIIDFLSYDFLFHVNFSLSCLLYSLFFLNSVLKDITRHVTQAFSYQW